MLALNRNRWLARSIRASIVRPLKHDQFSQDGTRTTKRIPQITPAIYCSFWCPDENAQIYPCRAEAGCGASFRALTMILHGMGDARCLSLMLRNMHRSRVHGLQLVQNKPNFFFFSDSPTNSLVIPIIQHGKVQSYLLVYLSSLPHRH